MSRKNVDLVRAAGMRSSSATSRAPSSTSAPTWSPIVSPAPLGRWHLHGPEGLLQATIDWAEGFDDLVMTAEEFFDYRSIGSGAQARSPAGWVL